MMAAGVPGLLAVPDSAAVSLKVLPSTHGVAEHVAAVVRVGVTGLTVKHSGLGVVPEPSSVASPRPVVPDVNFARQQYRPADVTLAASDKIGWTVR